MKVLTIPINHVLQIQPIENAFNPKLQSKLIVNKLIKWTNQPKILNQRKGIWKKIVNLKIFIFYYFYFRFWMNNFQWSYSYTHNWICINKWRTINICNCTNQYLTIELRHQILPSVNYSANINQQRTEFR